MARLTQAKLASLPDGLHNDGAVVGLYYRVRGEYRSWVFRRQIAGKRIELGMGGATMDLATARREASKLRALSADDFLKHLEEKAAAKEEAKQQEKVSKIPTFKEAALLYRAHKLEVGDWTEGTGTDRDFTSNWKNHVFPVLGDMKIDQIVPKDMVQLQKNLLDKPIVFNRCLRSIKDTFDWIYAEETDRWINPADKNGPLKHLLGKNDIETENYGAVNAEDLPDFIKELTENPNDSAKLFLFSILTATRSKTARLAKWEDIDLNEKVWWVKRIDLKIKSNGALIVPLSDQAIDILKSVGIKKEGWVFVGEKGNHYCQSIFSTLIKDANKARKAAGLPIWIDKAQTKERGKKDDPIIPTQHGTARGTFCTWALSDEYDNDQRFDSLVVEQALHHKIDKKYNGAYNRNKYLRRRRELMQAWADFCFSKVKTDGESK